MLASISMQHLCDIGGTVHWTVNIGVDRIPSEMDGPRGFHWTIQRYDSGQLHVLDRPL